MVETTGVRPDDKFLAEIFMPSMDITSLMELEHYTVPYFDRVQQKSARRAIDQENYSELKEYVLNRQQREQLLVAIPKKMDISQLAMEGAYPNEAPATYAEAAPEAGEYRGDHRDYSCG